MIGFKQREQPISVGSGTTRAVPSERLNARTATAARSRRPRPPLCALRLPASYRYTSHR